MPDIPLKQCGILAIAAAGMLALIPSNAQRSPFPTVSIRSAASTRPASPRSQRASLCLSRLPLAFESNRGQTDRRVRFVAHQPDSTLFLTPAEAVFSLQGSPRLLAEPASGLPVDPFTPASRIRRRATKPLVLRMQLTGADPHAKATGELPLPGTVNYLVGRGPGRRQTGIPTFAKTRFSSVYKGVDVVYYGNAERLEYDFLVAPHADPKQIGLRFGGADAVHVAKSGDLEVKLGGRTLRWKKPTVYQSSASGRQSVTCAYALSLDRAGRQIVRFATGRYDASRPLVIDPILLYSTYLGGGIGEAGDGIALDAAGCAYVTGFADSRDFPTTAGVVQTTNNSVRRANAFVTKLDPTGGSVLYSTYLGGSGFESGNAIAIDSAGQACITGETDSSDFPVTLGAYQQDNVSGVTAFVAKLNPAGTALVYATFLGGSIGEAGNGIALDPAGNAYVTGYTSSADFPTTIGALQPAKRSTNGANAFVAKLNADGTALLYSTYLGGKIGDYGNSVAIDAAGDAYITGLTYSANFPTSADAYQTTKRSVRSSNAFVSKLNPAGTALVYSTYLGGTGFEAGNGIALDAAGNAYVTGYTGSSNFPTTTGAYQTTNRSSTSSNAFVAKLNPAGTALVYSTCLGGNGGDYGNGIAVDPSGCAYVAGLTNSLNFPVSLSAVQPLNHSVSRSNAFVAKFDVTGGVLLYSTCLGGTQGDRASGIAIDPAGNAFITGSATSTDFPISSLAYQAMNHAMTEGTAFVTRVSIPALVADFNGDGNSDMLLQDLSGNIAAWFMNGATCTGGTYFSMNPPISYRLAGSGDFRGDGTLALVLQNSSDNSIALWYTSGTNHSVISGGDYVNPVPTAGWKVVGVGDFNGDGKSDLVFQNQTTNQIAIWFMNGPNYIGGVLMPYVPPAGWLAVGAGDLNGDGSPDLVFQNQSTSQIVVWFMASSTYLGGSAIGTTIASGWSVVGVADYNGDGYADLLFQNASSNQAAIWFMNGTTYLSGSALSLSPPAGWTITGPR